MSAQIVVKANISLLLDATGSCTPSAIAILDFDRLRANHQNRICSDAVAVPSVSKIEEAWSSLSDPQ